MDLRGRLAAQGRPVGRLGASPARPDCGSHARPTGFGAQKRAWQSGFRTRDRFSAGALSRRLTVPAASGPWRNFCALVLTLADDPGIADRRARLPAASGRTAMDRTRSGRILRAQKKTRPGRKAKPGFLNAEG